MSKWPMILACALWTTIALAQSADIVATVDDKQRRPVADAVVVAIPADGNYRIDERPRQSVVDQVDKEFIPTVLAIAAGTSVIFPNHDNVRHHVYSFSPAKRFELPLYAGVPARPIVFDTPGVVVLGCNIHDWMVGYVYVSESPFFAKTGKDGKARLSDLPPGSYVLRVWHPQLAGVEEATRKNVEAVRARSVDVGWTLELKPEIRVRRAPIPDHGMHY
jgi:plastocyanin